MLRTRLVRVFELSENICSVFDHLTDTVQVAHRESAIQEVMSNLESLLKEGNGLSAEETADFRKMTELVRADSGHDNGAFFKALQIKESLLLNSSK